MTGASARPLIPMVLLIASLVYNGGRNQNTLYLAKAGRRFKTQITFFLST